MSTEVTHKKGDISQIPFLILGWKGYSMLSLVGEEHLKATARHYKRLSRGIYDAGIGRAYLNSTTIDIIPMSSSGFASSPFKLSPMGIISWELIVGSCLVKPSS